MACRTRRPRWAWTTAWPSPRPCSTRDCPWWRRGPSFLRDGCRRWQGRTRCCAGCAGRPAPGCPSSSPTARASRPPAPRGHGRSRSSPPPARRSTARTSTPPSTSPSRASVSSCPRPCARGCGCAATCRPASAAPTRARWTRRRWSRSRVASQRPAATRSRSAMADQHTILVVDDHPDNRELMMRRLEREGFRAVGAESGREALARVKEGALSLVLLDVMMPEMSGLQVLQAVREAFTPAQLPVIMVTARTQSEDVVEALGQGANDYVTKPIDFPVALARIQAQLRIRQPPPDDEVANPRDLRPGLLLDGRYRMEARIGSGNFGTVYRARHLELDHAVALKVLQTSAVADLDAVPRFRRAGVTACRVRHPHAVSVLDFGITPRGVAYLVMELLAGYALEEEIKGGRQMPGARSGG